MSNTSPTRSGMSPDDQALFDQYTAQQSVAADLAQRNLTEPLFDQASMYPLYSGPLSGPFLPGKRPDTIDLETKLKQWYQMTADERAGLQQKLFVGGFYHPSVKASEIDFGNVQDNQGLVAYHQALVNAASLYQSGQRITVEQMLQQAMSGPLAAQRARTGLSTPSAGPTISVTSAAALAQEADKIAESVLGRGATPDEQRLIIAAVHRQETAFQASGGRGEIPNPTAITTQTLRQGAPVEAGAHDMADAYANLLAIVKNGGTP